MSRADGTAERAAELVALELGNGACVEVVAGVESAVAQEFKGGAVELVGARSGDDADLRAVALAVACAVGVGGDVELAHRIHAQQLAAGSSGVTLMSDAPVYSMPLSRKRLSWGRRPLTANMLPTEEFEVPMLPERSPV